MKLQMKKRLQMKYQMKKQNKMTEIIEIYGNNFTGKTLYALSLLEKNI